MNTGQGLISRQTDLGVSEGQQIHMESSGEPGFTTAVLPTQRTSWEIA